MQNILKIECLFQSYMRSRYMLWRDPVYRGEAAGKTHLQGSRDIAGVNYKKLFQSLLINYNTTAKIRVKEMLSNSFGFMKQKGETGNSV